MHLLPKQIALACTMMALVSFTSYKSRAWAQTSRPTNSTSQPTPNRTSKPTNSIPKNRVRLQPRQQELDFSGDGRPGRRAGGGSRSPCPAKDLRLAALIPVTNWGKTVTAYPTFWFYVPYSPQEAPTGEFALQDEADNDVYRTPLTLPATPGFVSFSLPPTAAPLEVNKWYRWYFKLYCEPQKLSSSIFVQGWVQRVELTPTLAAQLKAAKSQEYMIYATHGIWYDALARLAELRLTNPSNPLFQQDWTKLLSLKGVGLEQLDREVMVGSTILHQRMVSD